MTTPDRNEIERRCLSCLFKDSAEVLEAVAAGLKADHFSTATGRTMFLALVAAANASPETPPLEAVMAGSFAGSGMSMAEIVAIESLEVTSYKRRPLVDGVIGMAKTAKAMALMADAVASVRDVNPADWSEVWASLSPRLNDMASLTADHQTASFAQLCDEYVEQQRNPSTVRTVSLGIPAWDRKATLVKAHEMIVLAGRPGAGKTALAMQFARSVAKSGTVVFFSLEMSGVELISRLAVHEAGRDGVGDHPREVENRIKAIQSLRDVKTIKVIDDPYLTVEEIEARARLLAADKGGLSLVVIDYLQLIEVSADMKKAPREQQVAQMSRRLKLMPKRIGCPVLILGQLNREVEKENRAPRKSDLRESGAIEQDADRVWLLFQKMESDGRVLDENQIVLLQDKCRAGPQNIAALLFFDRPCFKFTPLTDR